MLKIKDLHVYYEEAHVIKGVNLNVQKGEIVCLLGRNGAGKTTLLKTIIGLIKPRRGTIIINDVNVTNWPSEKIAQLGVSYIPQERRVFPNLTVKENLAIGAHLSREERSIEWVLSLFPELNSFLNKKAGLLSGGEQQLVAIARALASNPKLLLMDEPYTGLMPKLIIKLNKAIKSLSKGGVSILITEQREHLALKISDRIYLIENGEILKSYNNINKK